MPLMLKFDVQNKASSEVNKLQKDLDKLKVSTKGAETSFGGLASSIPKVAGAMAVAYTAVKSLEKGYDLVIKKGFAYNKLIEEQINGLKTLAVATSSNTDSLGNNLTVMQKYNLAGIEATKTFEQLRKINAETPHTLGQTAQIYKAMYPSMKNVGASTKDLVQLTKTLSIASGAAGIEFNSLLAGVDGLATGTVLANSDLGRLLKSLGITNEKLKESKNVTELLNNTFKDFKGADTMAVSVSNLENAWDGLVGTITKDYFDIAKNSLKELSKELENVTYWTHAYLLEGKSVAEVAKNGSLADINFKIAQSTRELTEELKKEEASWTSLGKKFWTNEDKTKHQERLDSIKAEIFTLNEMKKIREKEANGATLTKKDNAKELSAEEVKLILKNISIITDMEYQAESDRWDAKTKLEEEALASKIQFEKDWQEFLGQETVKEFENKLSAQKKFFDLTATESDKINKKYADNLEIFEDMFSPTQMEKFFEAWAKELEGIEKQQKTYEGMGSSSWSAGLKGQAKDIANIGNAVQDLGEEQKRYAKFTYDTSLTEEERARAREQHTVNQIDGYSAMAGAMAGAFEEGSREAEAMIVIQKALSIVSGITAIATAMASGDGYTAVARGLAVAGTLASFGWAGGGGSSSVSAESKRQDNIASNIKGIEAQSSPILERLDSQIKLLESIDNSTGSATYKSLTQARAEYDKDIKIFAQESSAKATTSWKSFIPVGSEQELFNLRERVASDGKILSELIGGYSGLYFDYENKYSSGKRTGYEATYTSANILENPDYMIKYLSNISEFEGSLLDINNVFTSLELEEVVVNAQSVFSKFAVSIRDTVAELSDMSDTFKDLYDSITGTTSYSDEKLRLAREAVLGKNGIVGSSSITDYLSEQIKAITLIENSFDESARKLLLSTDSKDIEAQSELLIKLQESTSSTFINGAETALNYLDSIKLVGEAMADSTDNIKSWSDSFKTNEELASEMISSQTYKIQEWVNNSSSWWGGSYELVDKNYELASSMEELSIIYERMANDVDWLTDAELEALNANKALITARIDEKDELNKQLDLLKIYNDAEATLSYNRELALESVDETNKKLLEQIHAQEDLNKAKEEELALSNASINNIKSWSDSFKTTKELAQETTQGLTFTGTETAWKTELQTSWEKTGRQVFSRWSRRMVDEYEQVSKYVRVSYEKEIDVAVTLVSSMEELSDMFTKLSTDADGLTDAEMEYLNANRALIEARVNERNSLQETYDLLIGATTQRELQLASLDDSNKALQEAIWAEEDRQKAISESQSLIDDAVANFTSNMSTMAGSIDSTINTIKGNMLDDSLTTDQIRRLNLTQRAFETSIGAGDSDKAKELLSEITTLATGISSGAFGDTSKINKNLISSLEANKAMIDFKDEVLMVRIVASDLDYTQATQAVTPSVYVTNSTNNDDRLATLEAIMTEVLKTNINVYDLLLRIQNNGLKTI